MLNFITQQPDLALGIIRITLGVIFLAHGSQKVFGLFGGPGLQGFAQWTASSLGTPVLLGYLAALFEFIGGLLLVLGIASELGAALLVPIMLVAIFGVHWTHGFFSQNNGFEYPLLLLILAVVIIIGGPGKWYLWKLF